MRQQIDCVVISDHNNEAWINVLKAELANMSRDSSCGELADFRPLTLFRGEHTATGNVHIFAVLHTRSTSAEEEQLLVQCNTTTLFRVIPPIITAASGSVHRPKRADDHETPTSPGI